MKFDEFSDYVTQRLIGTFEERGEVVAVNIKKVVKNNGYELTALTVCRDGYNVSPTAYLEQFYSKYEEYGDIDSVFDELSDIFSDKMYNKNISVDSYYSYDDAKDNIIVRLINYDKNKEILNDIPFIPYLDLAITFRWIADINDNGLASVLVSNSDIARWNITIDDLYDVALDNTVRLFTGRVENMFELLKNRYNYNEYCNIKQEDGQLFVISNEIGVNGASVILYPNILDFCAEIVHDNVYIMPSSIHEMIFIAASYVDNPDYLIELVRDANNSVVHSTEILSYNVYFYDYNRKTLDIVH